MKQRNNENDRKQNKNKLCLCFLHLLKFSRRIKDFPLRKQIHRSNGPLQRILQAHKVSYHYAPLQIDPQLELQATVQLATPQQS